MVRLLSIISLILAIVLFPPAALALISNNAVPGDAIYPIKRVLEDGIFAVASLNPITKAWFAAARSDRRFQEFTTLITQGKKSGETLNELVEQTQVAASQIDQVKDEGQKQKLIQQLSDSIKKYDQGLEQLSIPPSAQSSLQPRPVATPLSQPLQATPMPTPVPTPAPVQQTTKPQPTQTPNVQPTPDPTSPPQPTSTPVPVVTPVPIPPSPPSPVPGGGQISCDLIEDEIQKARCKLGQIQVGLQRGKIGNERPGLGKNSPESDKNPDKRDKESGESGRNRKKDKENQ